MGWGVSKPVGEMAAISGASTGCHCGELVPCSLCGFHCPLLQGVGLAA